MTKSKYYTYLVLKSFGAKIAQRRLADATHEMHLLKDAQELLGFYNSDHIEEIDELKTEYWEIKNLKKQIDDLEEEEDEIQESLHDAIQKKNEVGEGGGSAEEELDNKINELVDQREEYLEKRTTIFNEGKRVRKVYDGLKAKMDYFINDLDEDDPERLDTAKRLEDCVTELTFLKGERDSIVSVIENIENQIQGKEDELNDIKAESDFESFTSYSDVGGKNKKLTEIRSRRAILQNNLDKNVRYVGRFLFANRKDREVNGCIKSHREIVHQANALRKSIILNHKLVDSRVEMMVED